MKDETDPAAFDKELAEGRQRAAGGGAEPDLGIAGIADTDALRRPPDAVAPHARARLIRQQRCNPRSQTDRVDTRGSLRAERHRSDGTFAALGGHDQLDRFGPRDGFAKTTSDAEAVLDDLVQRKHGRARSRIWVKAIEA